MPHWQCWPIATIVFALLRGLVLARRFRIIVVLSVSGVGGHIAWAFRCGSPGGGSPLADLYLHGFLVRCSIPNVKQMVVQISYVVARKCKVINKKEEGNKLDMHECDRVLFFQFRAPLQSQ